MIAMNLAEGAVTNVIDYIRANIGTALDAVALKAGPPAVSLESFKSYFIYEKPQGYALPACFVLMPDMDFRIKETASNFVNASDKISVICWVEDQDEEALTYKAWRYQSALFALLDQANIISADNSLKLVVVVYHAEFSALQQVEGPASGSGAIFRKAILLRCEVDHLENYA